jgi:hypothetical protein
MKKIVLTVAAVAALGLAACTPAANEGNNAVDLNATENAAEVDVNAAASDSISATDNALDSVGNAGNAVEDAGNAVENAAR